MIHLSISKAFEFAWDYANENPGKVTLAVSAIFLLIFYWVERKYDSQHELMILDAGRRRCWNLSSHGIHNEHLIKAAISIEKVIHHFGKPKIRFHSIMAARDELKEVLLLTSRMGIDVPAIQEAKQIIDELIRKKMD